MKKQPERIEKIRALRKNVGAGHHTVIVVVTGIQGVFEYFHIDAEVFKKHNRKVPTQSGIWTRKETSEIKVRGK